MSYKIKNSTAPTHIKIRGARVYNLKNINVDVPLNKIVGIAGVSGSGKSSLALGVLYAEGSRRYLESLSTYTRRRMTGAAKAQVDEVLYVAAALALHQRPAVPGIRSTFGTGTELLNSLRLMYSRLASHRCPNGHYVPPTLNVAAEQKIICPECSGSRLSEKARAPRIRGIGLADACKMTLEELVEWVKGVPDSLPEQMRPMAESICESFQTVAAGTPKQVAENENSVTGRYII